MQLAQLGVGSTAVFSQRCDHSRAFSRKSGFWQSSLAIEPPSSFLVAPKSLSGFVHSFGTHKFDLEPLCSSGIHVMDNPCNGGGVPPFMDIPISFQWFLLVGQPQLMCLLSQGGMDERLRLLLQMLWHSSSGPLQLTANGGAG